MDDQIFKALGVNVERGRVLFLVCLLMLFTAATSALVDNVTVMLLVVPVSIELAVPLKVNPTAFLIPEVFAANLGGAATLIGDPPNLLIGSAAGFSFLDFLANISGIVLICLAAAVAYYFFWYRSAYRRAFDLDFARTLTFLKQEYRIREPRLLRLALIILAGVLALFLVHHLLGMQPSVAALMGAMLLLTISRLDIVPLLEQEVEWPTLLFLMALFKTDGEWFVARVVAVETAAGPPASNQTLDRSNREVMHVRRQAPRHETRG